MTHLEVLDICTILPSGIGGRRGGGEYGEDMGRKMNVERGIERSGEGEGGVRCTVKTEVCCAHCQYVCA